MVSGQLMGKGAKRSDMDCNVGGGRVPLDTVGVTIPSDTDEQIKEVIFSSPTFTVNSKELKKLRVWNESSEAFALKFDMGEEGMV